MTRAGDREVTVSVEPLLPVAEHGWCYLNAAIDCCAREITGWALDVRCRALEATAVSKLKQRCIWREEFETLDEARHAIGAYVDRSHRRPHSRLAYRTPREVAATWKDHDDQLTPAA
jgi:transposase InsO family protein